MDLAVDAGATNCASVSSSYASFAHSCAQKRKLARLLMQKEAIFSDPSIKKLKRLYFHDYSPCLVARAKAVEKRWEEPKTIAETLYGPLAHVWGAAHTELMALAEGRMPTALTILCDKLESLAAGDGR